MVLYRAPQHLTLESLREEARIDAALHITALGRGWYVRRSVAIFRCLKMDLLGAMRTRQIPNIEKVISCIDVEIRPPFTLYREIKQAKTLIETIKSELELCSKIDELSEVISKQPQVTGSYFEQIEAVLTRASELEIAKNYANYSTSLSTLDRKIAGARE